MFDNALRLWRHAGVWGLIDGAGHALHLPDKLMKPMCDRYDVRLGISRQDLVEMDYRGRAPWWLRI